MKKSYVVDTNVGIVANDILARDYQEDCITACINVLEKIKNEGLLILDKGSLIIDEYRRYLSPSGRPGSGDEFMAWLIKNQWNMECCILVEITPESDNTSNFEEFPDDPELAGFDRSDRKFVAVALASRKDPEIINASDTDWWIYKTALESHGVNVCFLCPELMNRNA